VVDSGQRHGASAQIIGAVSRLTVALVVVGVGLILGGFVTIPLVGYAAATIGAVGTWSLSLGAVTACLWLLAAMLHRAWTGQWHWGRAPRRAFSKKGWLRVAIVAVGVVILVIVFDYI